MNTCVPSRIQSTLWLVSFVASDLTKATYTLLKWTFSINIEKVVTFKKSYFGFLKTILYFPLQ